MPTPSRLVFVVTGPAQGDQGQPGGGTVPPVQQIKDLLLSNGFESVYVGSWGDEWPGPPQAPKPAGASDSGAAGGASPAFPGNAAAE